MCVCVNPHGPLGMIVGHCVSDSDSLKVAGDWPAITYKHACEEPSFMETTDMHMALDHTSCYM